MAHEQATQYPPHQQQQQQRYNDLPLPQIPTVISSLPYRPRRSTTSDMTDPLPALSQWQSDDEVSKCPVCSQEFGFWYRKHHCRKCGRVICADCSRHRVTLPQQYIVQPPWELGSAPSTAPGESVRVCNPCVPDPWLPTSRGAADPSARPPAHHRYSMPSQPLPQPRQGRPGQHAHRYSIDSSRRSAQFAVNPLAPFYLNPSALPQQSRAGAPSLPQRRGSAPQRQPPVIQSAVTYRPRKVVKEEDECPVCGIELEPGEQLREQHITSCIATRFGSPARNATPPTTTAASPLAGHAEASTPPPSHPLSNSHVRAQSYRSRGLYSYKATEKDCMDNNGQEQECPICFEEFQPGDALGRLECLCRFHSLCIRQWWSRKGPGMCPVHASHE